MITSSALTRHISRGHVICPLPIIQVRLSYPNTDRMSDMNLVDYLLTQGERVASFLNFVPVDLEITMDNRRGIIHEITKTVFVISTAVQIVNQTETS